jgi:DNA processing protein
MAEHGTAQAALDALPEVARAAGAQEYQICPEGVALAELKAGRRAGARLICAGSPAYPADLAEIADAPAVLWALGDLSLLARPRVALVGARNASSLGLRMARRLAEGLGAAGITVVSGLARGIDAEAHRAALATGTIGVQAGGIDVIYPLENADLAAQMATQGLRLSEQPPGMAPKAQHFPQRNRIISGLSCAVVVVEAAARSGSLLTAKDALDQGREVMAVPGHPMDGRAWGCNMLIRDGAVLVRGAEDILQTLGLEAAGPPASPAPARATPPATPRSTAPDDIAQRILTMLGPSPTPEDQVIRDLGLEAAALAGPLLDLEMEGKVQRHAGGLLSRIA